jgi:hypothetical protein
MDFRAQAPDGKQARLCRSDRELTKKMPELREARTIANAPN